MLRNDYRRALIVLRPHARGMSGHVRLERRTLTGTMHFTVQGSSAGVLHAILLTFVNGYWVKYRLGTLKSDARGQSGMTASFDPRNLRGMDLDKYALVALVRTNGTEAPELVMTGMVNGYKDVNWAQVIAVATDEFAEKPRVEDDRQKEASLTRDNATGEGRARTDDSSVQSERYIIEEPSAPVSDQADDTDVTQLREAPAVIDVQGDAVTQCCCMENETAVGVVSGEVGDSVPETQTDTVSALNADGASCCCREGEEKESDNSGGDAAVLYTEGGESANADASVIERSPASREEAKNIASERFIVISGNSEYSQTADVPASDGGAENAEVIAEDIQIVTPDEIASNSPTAASDAAPATSATTESVAVPATSTTSESATAPATAAPTESAAVPATSATSESVAVPATSATTESAAVPATSAPTESAAAPTPAATEAATGDSVSGARADFETSAELIADIRQTAKDSRQSRERTQRKAAWELLRINPDLSWPEDVMAVRELFERAMESDSFRLDDFVFVDAPLPSEDGTNGVCAIGLKTRDGRPVSVCYALPGSYSIEPPPGLEDYSYLGGWWYTVLDLL